MKKLLIPVFLMLLAFSAQAQETDCPFGYENDPAPGSCGLYTDQNGDYLCDLSEVPHSSLNTAGSNKQVLTEDELKLLSVNEMAEYYNVSGPSFANALSEFLKTDIKTSDNMGVLHDSVGLCTGVAAQIATNLEAGFTTLPEEHDALSGQEIKEMSVTEVASAFGINQNTFITELSKMVGVQVKASDEFVYLHDTYDLRPAEVKDLANKLEGASANIVAPVQNKRPPYLFVPISLGIIILYGITYILALQKKITIITHRKIWNVILTIAFLISGVLGLMLVLRINYGWFAEYHRTMLTLHVDFGIAMAVITFFHMAWHWPYYRNLLPKK